LVPVAREIREIGKIKDREWPKICRFPAEAVDKFQWSRREKQVHRAVQEGKYKFAVHA